MAGRQAVKEIHVRLVEKRMVGLKCPNCARLVDGGTGINDTQAPRQPKPGDFSICMYCGSLNCFTAGPGLRKVDRRERRMLERDPRLTDLVSIAVTVAARIRRQQQ